MNTMLQVGHLINEYLDSAFSIQMFFTHAKVFAQVREVSLDRNHGSYVDEPLADVRFSLACGNQTHNLLRDF